VSASAVAAERDFDLLSFGETMARLSTSTGRVPARSARVKNSLKLAYAVGSGSTASDMSGLKPRTNSLISAFLNAIERERVAASTRREMPC
jgi:hypothetical protein